MSRGRSSGVVVKLLACGARGRGSIPSPAASISETGYFLLPSRDMAEISQRRLKTSIQQTTNEAYVFCRFQYEEWKKVCLNSIVRLSCVDWGLNERYFVHLSFLNPNMRSEMKRILSVINANIRGEMKWNSLSVLRRFQYQGWKKFVRLVWIPNKRGEMTFVRLSLLYYPAVLRRLKFKG